MSFSKIYVYLKIRETLEAILPENHFRFRLILADNSIQKEKHCYVLHIFTVHNELILKKQKLIDYCAFHKIVINNLDSIRFRYYFRNFQIPSLDSFERTKLRFLYAKVSGNQKRRNNFEFICCKRQFLKFEKFNLHWDQVHEKSKVSE